MTTLSEERLGLMAAEVQRSFPHAAIRVGILTFGAERRLNWHIAMPHGPYGNIALELGTVEGAEDNGAAVQMVTDGIRQLQPMLA